MLLALGRLAQLVEHALDVRRVSGSSPLSSTNQKTTLWVVFFYEIHSLRQQKQFT